MCKQSWLRYCILVHILLPKSDSLGWILVYFVMSGAMLHKIAFLWIGIRSRAQQSRECSAISTWQHEYGTAVLPTHKDIHAPTLSHTRIYTQPHTHPRNRARAHTQRQGFTQTRAHADKHTLERRGRKQQAPFGKPLTVILQHQGQINISPHAEDYVEICNSASNTCSPGITCEPSAPSIDVWKTLTSTRMEQTEFCRFLQQSRSLFVGY